LIWNLFGIDLEFIWNLFLLGDVEDVLEMEFLGIDVKFRGWQD
jgi:hypothetical protein